MPQHDRILRNMAQDILIADSNHSLQLEGRQGKIVKDFVQSLVEFYQFGMVSEQAKLEMPLTTLLADAALRVLFIK